MIDVRSLALSLACLAMVLASCGGSAQKTGQPDTGSGEEGQARSATVGNRPSPGPTVQMSKTEVAKLPPLKIPTASGPPPKHLVVVDLHKGSGPAVAKTDAVSIRWIEDTYPQARKGRQGALSGGEVSWKSWKLDEASNAFQVGLPNMRIGGRRELIVPPKIAYPRWQPSWGYAPYVSVYVVDLLGVEPG